MKENGAIRISFTEDRVSINVGPWWLDVTGNVVTYGPSVESDADEAISFAQRIPTYDNPCYATFEEFCRWCGPEGLRVALADFDMGVGAVVYIYDHRPHRPLELDDVRPELRAAVEENPEEWLDTDAVGGNFGYALNLFNHSFSEWGYAPFPLPGEDVARMNERKAESLRQTLDALGGNVVHIDGPQIVTAIYEGDDE